MPKKSKKANEATARANEELDQWILEHVTNEGDEEDYESPTEHDLLNEHGDTSLEAVKASLARLVAGGYVQIVDGAVELVRKPGAAPAPSDDEAPAPMPTRCLKCILTADELAAKAEEIDATFDRIASVEADLARLQDSVKTAKGRLDGLFDDASRLSRTRRDGYEFRDVECFERRNDEALTIETVRADLGEVIETRPLTKSERQGALFSDAEISITDANGASVTLDKAAGDRLRAAAAQ